MAQTTIINYIKRRYKEWIEVHYTPPELCYISKEYHYMLMKELSEIRYNPYGNFQQLENSFLDMKLIIVEEKKCLEVGRYVSLSSMIEIDDSIWKEKYKTIQGPRGQTGVEK